MYTIPLLGRGDFSEWRDAARMLATAGVSPREADWRVYGLEEELFEAVVPPPLPKADGIAPPLTVPPGFLPLAEAVVCHTEPGRYHLLYRLLWRLQSDRRLLELAADKDVAWARLLAKNVHRDSHKMTAFVRFKEIAGVAEGRRRFFAWFEPTHFIVARTAPFFRRRFADMDWIIATPMGTASWDGESLIFDVRPAENPGHGDPTDELWRTYYSSIFNPARLKLKAMQTEMPKKYWRNLPEADLIPEMIANAEANVRAMAERAASDPPLFHYRLQDAAHAEPQLVPVSPGTIAALREEARHCTRCPLHCTATQTVFGEGPQDARVMMVGEQPGDQEDLAGRPFVGPAGKVFDAVLKEADIARDGLYLTNAVKHFKYEPRGKRRIHQKPDRGDIEHCRWWLAKEVELVKPRLIVALGATAVFALSGEQKPLSQLRGKPITMERNIVLYPTIHPSYLLRLPDEAARKRQHALFVEDMQLIKHLGETLAAQQ
ncbi:UdgX family uracil-DNA binding protein [Shinella kummerowiae]|jgi:probable DNA metabolism protein|uniref:Type-4 uracil-DNA glycosylase n=1 Tax=Shinella kummerowiae TaxID=417745 RepID=A0A6N8SB55_9HYPH|nr:UdgX family uracil-DNA binding protein [Shinella kummerowiae]MXN44192.1 UdgX family uracil-DNA binding protein [Shinella kummerowiae]